MTNRDKLITALAGIAILATSAFLTWLSMLGLIPHGVDRGLSALSGLAIGWYVWRRVSYSA